MTDLTKEIVLTSLGGLIGYLTAKHNRVWEPRETNEERDTR
jgi:hypothetical protein